MYQSNCWNQALISNPDLPSPTNWDWKKDQTAWQPVWSTLTEASQSCSELIHCGCVLGGVNVSRQPSNALHFVSVLVIASNIYGTINFNLSL